MKQLLQRAALGVALASGIAGPVLAQGYTNPFYVFPAPFYPVGYEQITLSAGAAGLTSPVTAGMAVFEVDTSGTSIRWRNDGVSPTSSVGMEVLPGGGFSIVGSLSVFKAIQTSGTAKLNVTYYK